MSLPTCEICQEHKASILICLEHDGQAEKHHVCMDCVGEIADGELAEFLGQSNVDFTKLQVILQQMQKMQDLPELEMDPQEISTLQKLQAMMGDDAEPDLDDMANVAMGKVLSGEAAPNESADESRCSECGTTWNSIHEDGLVGCPHCYVTFAAPLEKVMQQLHRSTSHTGKIPRFREKQERLKEHQEKRQQHRVEMLQKRLEAAIETEDYEEAAQIRDKIAQVSK